MQWGLTYTGGVMEARQLTPSPFLPNPDHPCVAVARNADSYAAAREALAGFDLSAASGKRVLVKPNAGRIAAPGDGITTNPAVVAAAIAAFQEAGAEVAVGESPITGVSTLDALRATGIAAVAEEYGCPLLDMDARQPVEISLPEGKAIHSLKVCPEVFEFDLIVSVPVMKVHMHTGVTLAVKNMKGCLWRRSKVELHMLPALEDSDEKMLNIAIADMAHALRPHFCLVDGTTGMEGLGPSAGTPRRLDTVVAGADAFAVDAVACRLMGMEADQVPHLRIGAERGLGIIDLDRIDVTPDRWTDWSKDFARAPESLSFEFPNVEVLDEQSCSACQSTLLLLLQRHREALLDYFPPDEPLRIAIGKGHEGVPPGTLCIGNCTARHKTRGIFVPGCPPVGSAILKEVSSEFAEDQD